MAVDLALLRPVLTYFPCPAPDVFTAPQDPRRPLLQSRAVRISRFLLALLVPIVLLVGGTLGYHLIEGWPLFDAFYMTVITLTTVGYGEVHHLSHAGRVFTVILLLFGVFTVFYLGTELIRGVISGELGELLGRQRMERSLAGLKDHVIVCGHGRMGRFVCREFSAMKLPFVAIERNAQALEGLHSSNGKALHLVGDATSDEVLDRAGVTRARSLISALPSDADNLYITMTARLLNERLFIIARAEEDVAEQKLLRAGANRVISPYVLAGHKVSQAVLRPSVVDFIELASKTTHLELQIEEIQLASGSSMAGQQLRDSTLRRDLGVVVLAIRKPTGAMVSDPAPETVLEVGDTLVTLGRRDQLDRVAALARG
jgi:voltage-gated potassium channel